MPASPPHRLPLCAVSEERDLRNLRLWVHNVEKCSSQLTRHMVPRKLGHDAEAQGDKVLFSETVLLQARTQAAPEGTPCHGTRAAGRRRNSVPVAKRVAKRRRTPPVVRLTISRSSSTDGTWTSILLHSIALIREARLPRACLPHSNANPIRGLLQSTMAQAKRQSPRTRSRWRQVPRCRTAGSGVVRCPRHRI